MSEWECVNDVRRLGEILLDQIAAGWLAGAAAYGEKRVNSAIRRAVRVLNETGLSARARWTE